MSEWITQERHTAFTPVPSELRCCLGWTPSFWLQPVVWNFNPSNPFSPRVWQDSHWTLGACRGLGLCAHYPRPLFLPLWVAGWNFWVEAWWSIVNVLIKHQLPCLHPSPLPSTGDRILWWWCCAWHIRRTSREGRCLGLSLSTSFLWNRGSHWAWSSPFSSWLDSQFQRSS